MAMDLDKARRYVDDIIDLLVTVEERDCTEEVFGCIEAAVEDLRTIKRELSDEH